jgi:hypothetical protein
MSARVAVMFCKHVMVRLVQQCIQFSQIALVAIKHEISSARQALCFIGTPLFTFVMLERF